MRRWARMLAVTAIMSLTAASLVVAAPKESGSTSTYLVAVKSEKHAAKLMASAGYEIVADYSDLGNVVAVKTDANGLKKLKAMGDVESVDPEGKFTKLGTFNDAFPITWGLDAVNAPEAWNMGYKGQGIKVCILDTGIDYNHPEFYKNGVSIIKGSKNFVTDGHANAQDGDGHGTHVAGTIAAQGSTVWGVAPSVDLYIGRVLDDNGDGASTWILNGVKWCDSVGANIISMSLGGTASSTTERRTYDSVYSKGRLIIAAAGNAGTTAVSYPAGYANVVSVAAVDSNLAKADFSQYNSDVELSGPGVAVYSSLPPYKGHKDFTYEGTTSYSSTAIEYAPHGKVTGPLVECGLADTTTSCTGKPASGDWIALVSRGTISFADKAKNVMAQGAKGMILTNNDTANPDDFGSFTFGAAGTWPVATSVSYNSGVAIRAGGLTSGSVEIQDFNYGYNNGTSMATPHVSAVAALAWSAKPTLTNVTMRSVLQSTAQDLGAAGRDVNFGYGLVKADAAISLALTK